MKYAEIIGPCSKYIDGKGWVTQIPEELLKNKGYVKVENNQYIIDADYYKHLTNCERFIEMYKVAVGNLAPSYTGNTMIINPNAQAQDMFECNHLKCDMDGAHCSLGMTDCFDYCRLQRTRYCEDYEEKECNDDNKEKTTKRRRCNKSNK